jgi:hypothetical protein
MLNVPSKERLEIIPGLYASRSMQFLYRIIYLHFSLGSQNLDWYVSEFDGDDEFYGYVALGSRGNAEWCCFSFRELKALNINGVEVDCEPEDVWEPIRWLHIPGIMWRN